MKPSKLFQHVESMHPAPCWVVWAKKKNWTRQKQALKAKISTNMDALRASYLVDKSQTFSLGENSLPALRKQIDILGMLWHTFQTVLKNGCLYDSGPWCKKDGDHCSRWPVSYISSSVTYLNYGSEDLFCRMCEETRADAVLYCKESLTQWQLAFFSLAAQKEKKPYPGLSSL